MPGAIAPVGCAERLRAAARGARPQRRCRPACADRSPSTLRRRARRRCDHSSWRNSANGSMIVFESLPTPKRPPAREVRRAGKRAVAEIGLGRRREPGDRAARGEAARLRARSCASRGRRTSARRRSPASSSHSTGRMPAPRVALVDFARLLGGVDVDRRVWRRERARSVRAPPASRRAGCAARRRDVTASRRARSRRRSTRCANESTRVDEAPLTGASAARRRSPPCA